MDEDTVRKEFEAWAVSISLRISTALNDGRTYGHQHTHIAWLAWQAGRSSMAKEAAEIAFDAATNWDAREEIWALAEKEKVR
jgi:hypothetical protein